MGEYQQYKHMGAYGRVVLQHLPVLELREYEQTRNMITHNTLGGNIHDSISQIKEANWFDRFGEEVG